MKILNVSRKKPKGIATGLLEGATTATPLSPVKEEDEPEEKKKKLKSMELIRKFAPEMPALIATKI